MRTSRGWAGRVATFFGNGGDPRDSGITLDDVVREARNSGLPLAIGEKDEISYRLFADADGLKISAPDGTVITLVARTL